MEQQEVVAYTIPANLMQSVVSLLGEMPAARSRGVLNALEQACVMQDQVRQQQAEAARVDAAIRARAEAPAAP